MGDLEIHPFRLQGDSQTGQLWRGGLGSVAQAAEMVTVVVQGGCRDAQASVMAPLPRAWGDHPLCTRELRFGARQ